MEINSMLTWMMEDVTPSGTKNMDAIMKKLLKFRALEEGGRMMSDFITPGKSMDQLNKEALKLEILKKKRALGMDYDSGLEYEEDNNANDRAVKGMFTIKALNYGAKNTAMKNPQSLDVLLKEAWAMETTPKTVAMDRRIPKMAVSSGGSNLFTRLLGGKPSGYSSILRLIGR